jgi:1,4-dihydroxy-6-naphthoate synthase
METAHISLAYSVDADDAFMFHGLRVGKVDTRGLTFTHRRDHTAALNRLAAAGGADVVAVSVGAYPSLAGSYAMLPHGASVGRGFGPVVVARRPMSIADLAGARVGIPGTTTTAYLVLRLIQPAVVGVEIPIAPFARIFQALDAGKVEAALLIHEGRLLYQERGLAAVVDLGAWWLAETGLPLPLGVNVIRRGLGAPLVARVSAVLADSIRWAEQHRAEVIAAIAAEDRGEKALSRPELLDEYLKLYANDDTVAFADDARGAVSALFARAHAAGLVSGDVAVDWAE